MPYLQDFGLCDHCANLGARKRCSGCSVMQYHGPACAKHAWRAGHKLECGAWTSTTYCRPVMADFWDEKSLAACVAEAQRCRISGVEQAAFISGALDAPMMVWDEASTITGISQQVTDAAQMHYYALCQPEASVVEQSNAYVFIYATGIMDFDAAQRRMYRCFISTLVGSRNTASPFFPAVGITAEQKKCLTDALSVQRQSLDSIGISGFASRGAMMPVPPLANRGLMMVAIQQCGNTVRIQISRRMTPTQTAAGFLPNHTKVVLKGLQTRPELNGMAGIVGDLTKTGRQLVTLEDGVAMGLHQAAPAAPVGGTSLGFSGGTTVSQSSGGTGCFNLFGYDSVFAAVVFSVLGLWTKKLDEPGTGYFKLFGYDGVLAVVLSVAVLLCLWTKKLDEPAEQLDSESEADGLELPLPDAIDGVTELSVKSKNLQRAEPLPSASVAAEPRPGGSIPEDAKPVQTVNLMAVIHSDGKLSPEWKVSPTHEFFDAAVVFPSQPDHAGCDGECCICLDIPENPIKLGCSHYMCQPCLADLHSKALQNGTESSLNKCPICREPLPQMAPQSQVDADAMQVRADDCRTTVDEHRVAATAGNPGGGQKNKKKKKKKEEKK